MKSAYDQIEEAILPTLEIRTLGQRLMSQRVLRLCMEFERFHAIPDERRIGRSKLKQEKHNWYSMVYQNYKERYGLSVITIMLLSFVIKLAIDYLLELWLRADKRPLIEEALKQFKEGQ